MNFSELNLKPEVFACIQKLGYETPTKIQEEVIKESISGKNIVGQSQTGTGKTAAFVISILEKIDLTKSGVQALILAPTRELAIQIRDEIISLSVGMPIKSLPVYGGAPIFKQIEMLRKGQTIVVGTPGRTIDLIERGILDIKEVDMFVLDEVDRMLDMGFIDDIDFIWGNMTSVKQTMAFSATITQELKNIVEKYLGLDYTFIKAEDSLTVDKINHSFTEIPHVDKYDALKKIIITSKSKKTLVFVKTKRDTETLARKLYKDGFNSDCLNGDMRQRERFKALRDFQDSITDILIVTDVAARGINVKNINLVVNFDVPSDPESYIHRIGRTGRAGALGTAVMFVANDEKFAFKNIERKNRITIKQTDSEGNEIERIREERGNFGGRSSGGRFSSRNSRGARGGSRGSKFGSSFSSPERSFGGERKPFGDSKFSTFGSSSRGEKKSYSDDKKRPEFKKTEGGFGRSKSAYFEKKEAMGGGRNNFSNPERSFGGEKKTFGGERKTFSSSKFEDKKSFGNSKFSEKKNFLNPKTEGKFSTKPKFDSPKKFTKKPGTGFKKKFR